MLGEDSTCQKAPLSSMSPMSQADEEMTGMRGNFVLFLNFFI